MEQNNNPNQKSQLSIDISKDIAKGEYSNLAIITHSRNEFIMDFASLLPGFPKAEVLERIIMVPEHAKRLLNALQDNIVKYESSFGIIDVDGVNNREQRGGNTFNLGDFGPFGGGKQS